MAEPRKISQEQYNKLRSAVERNYNYDKMSDADKAMFDRVFDETVVPDNGEDDEADF